MRTRFGSFSYFFVALAFIYICFGISESMAQESHAISQNHTFRQFDRYVYQSDNRFHTSVKPFLMHQLDSIIPESTFYPYNVQSWWAKALFNQSWVQFDKENVAFTIDPLLNFEVGREWGNSESSWINTRGILVNVRLGKKVQITTQFLENQAMFNDPRKTLVVKQGVIPGQGRPKGFGEGGYDYGFSEGQVSYTPNTHFNFTFGHGKNFIGDGYRSLLLSDNAFNYPYFRITTDFWHIKYVNLWAQMQDLTVNKNYGYAFDKKWVAMHYLDWSVTKWFNIGFFEAIVWQHADSLGVRGFDFNYANPVIFMRPVEFSVGSPDNALMGINGKITLFKKHVFYAQALIDEFVMEELLAGSGWWANKWAVQAGYKTFNLFGVEHLDIQCEFNAVRPFTYSHLVRTQNYGHYNAPLAHPLGSNFLELVSFMRYQHKRLFFEGRYSYALHGSDSANSNFGNDIYKTYDTRIKDYDNFFGQNEKVWLQYMSLQMAYMINPRSNMNVYVRYDSRTEKTIDVTDHRTWITFGIKTSLQNFYYDF